LPIPLYALSTNHLYTPLVFNVARWHRTTCFSCLLKGGVGKGKSFLYNHKVMVIKFKSRHIILWLLGNLWPAKVRVRDWLCKEKTHHPMCTLPKVSYIIVWLFFRSNFYLLVSSKVQDRSLFMKESLPNWMKF
jgi:hypothetical protein